MMEPLPRPRRSASMPWMETVRARRRFTLVALAVAAVAGFSWAPRASAMVWEEEDEPPPVHTAPPTVSSTSIAGLFGMPSLTAAVRSNDARVRAAGVARAAEVALQATESAARDDAWRLVEAAAADNADDLDGALLVRLAAARALAANPRKEGRPALEGLLGSPEPMRKATAPTPAWGGPSFGGWPPPAPPPPKAIKPANADLVRFVRETAAMALGVRGDHEALLLRARSRENVEASRAAFGALVAYPASSLATILPKGEGVISRDTVDLLARLLDVRGADPLLKTAEGKDDTSAAVAIVALARLGDGRVVNVARAVGKDSRIELRIAALEALAELSEPSADATIATLLGEDKTASEAKRIAVRHPTPALVAVLEKIARGGDAAAVGALGRVGAPGIERLSAIAADDSLPLGIADVAAHQLAISPLDGASDAVRALLDKNPSPARKRRAVRAAAVRVARIGSAPGALKSAAKDLASSKDAADRAAGTLLLGVLDLSACKDALASDDLPRRRAGVAALMSHSINDAAAVARAHLSAHASTEPTDVAQALAAVAARAIDGSVARDVPVSTAQLAAWLSEDSAASPLAAFLLAARGGDTALAHVMRALSADSLDVRAAALLGLGLSPEKSATGELSARLREVPYVALRRAAVRALVARADTAGRATIELARKLDPDVEVRNVSAAAKLGTRTTPLLSGAEVAQARVTVGAANTIAIVASVDGLVLPHVVDPEGFVFAFRLAPGPARIEARALATPSKPGKGS